jgi:hypothetical protein
LIIVGLADSVATGAFPVACMRVDASSAAAAVIEIDARAIDLTKNAHVIEAQPRMAPLAKTRIYP